MTLALAVLVASLLGSVHCVAMCSAFSCVYANADATWRSSWPAHTAYHLGRLGAYLLLGTAAGILGVGLDRGGSAFAGVANAAAIVTGVLLVLWGANAILMALGARGVVARPPARWQHAMGAALQRVAGTSSWVRGAATGLLTTLLPCGWLYAFVVVAAGTGSASRGAMLMGVFWCGTLPLMLTAAAGLQRLNGAVRARLPLASAATIFALGVFSLAAHLGLVPVGGWLHALMPDIPNEAAATAAHGHLP